MGSFDMACSVSGITLAIGQPVKMFFIIEDLWHEDGVICTSTDKFKFCTFGISMKYDDYGRYTVDESDPEWIRFIQMLKTYSVADDDNNFDPQKTEHLKPDYLFDLTYKGVIKLKSGKGLAKIFPFPVHKDIYEKVCLKPYVKWNGTKVDKAYLSAEAFENAEKFSIETQFSKKVDY